MSKKFLITENEKNQIKSLYNINEDMLSDFMSIIKSEMIKVLKNSGTNNNSGSVDSNNNSGSVDSNNNSGSVDSKWNKITKKVIDEFEGGYWNPKCGHTTKGMGISTETMFGLDRKNGKIESTPEGKEFFRIIDNEKTKLGMTNFCKTWKHYYRGGNWDGMPENYHEDKTKFVNQLLEHPEEYNLNLNQYVHYN